MLHQVKAVVSRSILVKNKNKNSLAVIPHETQEGRRFPLAVTFFVTSVHMCAWQGGTRRRREVSCDVIAQALLLW